MQLRVMAGTYDEQSTDLNDDEARAVYDFIGHWLARPRGAQ
jgi:hypothetical protein